MKWFDPSHITTLTPPGCWLRADAKSEMFPPPKHAGPGALIDVSQAGIVSLLTELGPFKAVKIEPPMPGHAHAPRPSTLLS